MQATHVTAEDLNGKVQGAAPRGLDRSEDVELIHKNLSRYVGAAENVQERHNFYDVHVVLDRVSERINLLEEGTRSCDGDSNDPSEGTART
jgi:hypothetical protein